MAHTGAAFGLPPRVRLIRIIFALKSPLPTPDGLVVPERISDEPGPGAEDGDLVHLVFHEVWTPHGTLSASASASEEVINKLGLGQSTPAPGDQDQKSEARFRHTVVDATTADTFTGDARNARPSEDSILRIVEAVAQVARAFRLAGASVEIPTYESLPPILLTWRTNAEGTRELFTVDDRADWTPSVMWLETVTASPTFVDQSLAPAADDDTVQQAREWMYAIRTNEPLTRSVEWLRRADHALNVTGSYADAVLHASTAGEVLIDGLLSALMWEENFLDPAKPTAEESAALFIEGQGKNRATNHLRSRLGGNWDADTSAWQGWNLQTAVVRNRVVHAGYAAPRAEAELAVVATKALQTWLCDLLCAKRTTYRRVTIMMLGSAGLNKRGAWNGQIKQFAEQEADSEVHWQTDFATWHTALVASM